MTDAATELLAYAGFILFQASMALLWIGLSEPTSAPGQALAFVTGGSF